MSIETEASQELSIGQILRQAREARGLTLQQVASQLNLAVPLIEKLEQDQFNGNILETYVRGYIRAYAKLLKVPQKQLLLAFSRETGRQGDVAKPMQTFSNRTKRQATDKRFVWLTYGIIALFIVLLFVWWWQTEAAFTLSNNDSTATDVATISTPQLLAKILSDKPADATEQAMDNPAEILLESVSSDPVSSVVPSAASDLENMLPSTIAMVDGVTKQDSLTMRFIDDCWVNVIDAAGERIAFGTKEKGYSMTLKGKAPFVVTLGNPAVVVISFNQQPYDTSALPTGRVAKFTIPGSE